MLIRYCHLVVCPLSLHWCINLFHAADTWKLITGTSKGPSCVQNVCLCWWYRASQRGLCSSNPRANTSLLTLDHFLVYYCLSIAAKSGNFIHIITCFLLCCVLKCRKKSLKMSKFYIMVLFLVFKSKGSAFKKAWQTSQCRLENRSKLILGFKSVFLHLL